jgi:cobalt-zinc-cadmium efflux system membrane fusion protein
MVAGCGGPAATPPETGGNPGDSHATVATGGAKREKKSHSHEGWWCDEHGVPEEICGQCNAKLAAEFQKKGDWCKEHDRPDSQCFICHPELEAKFAARYEAKFGTPPSKHE